MVSIVALVIRHHSVKAMSVSENVAITEKNFLELRQSYDELARSSKELETELEYALDALRLENQQLAAKNSNLESRLAEVLEKHKKVSAELNRSHNIVDNMKEKELEMKTNILSLEIEKEDLTNNVRILEASVGELQYKLENAEEAVILLKCEIDDMKEAKLDVSALKIEATSSSAVEEILAHSDDVLQRHEVIGSSDFLFNSRVACN